MSGIKVDTSFTKDFIVSEVYAENDRTLSVSEIFDREQIVRSVLNLQEEGVRKALIDLGWTPPTKQQGK